MAKDSNIRTQHNLSLRHRSALAHAVGGGGGGRFRWLALLIGVAILGITGFQLYWLRQNYGREKRSLSIKSEMAFQETILRLQVAKLKLDGIPTDSVGKGNGGTIYMTEKDGKRMTVRFKPKEEIISTINVIRSKLKDSLKMRTDVKSGYVVTLDNNSFIGPDRDSLKFRHGLPPRMGKGDHIFKLLYDVDSLQDPLHIKEIDSAYALALKEEKLAIPFTIVQLDSSGVEREEAFNQVTVGIAHPVTYRLQLGNTFPYLFRQLLQPVLFSIALLAITILSFVLLYRSLLKQRRLAELKNEFISNITHELKTPIATVGVAIEALKNFNAMQDPARTKEYLDISSNELQRLNLLVDKVLKLSLFEKKEMELKFETVDLKSIVDEVVESLKLQLEKNKASVSVHSQGELGMQGDRLHLLSVVFNLLDNAIKYSREAPVIQIDLQGNDDSVILAVTDNGIGIPQEYKEKVFEKFFRIPHGDTHNAKGYGLGLSYVSQVVAKHQGTIVLESQAGTGTTFTLRFPKKFV